MKKQILAMVLVLALAIALFAPAALALPYGAEHQGYYNEAVQQYADVPTTHWAYAAIADCSQRDWFEGYPDSTFRPNQKISRAEAAKVFCKAMGLTPQSGNSFVDTENHWAAEFIEATKVLFPNVQNLQGTSSFRPNQTITREETVYALVVAWRYASKTKNADWSVLNMFRDTDSISEAIKPYMAVAVEEGLVSGFEDDTIRAQDGLSRAQFATLLYRALNHGYGPDSTAAPTITLASYPMNTTERSVTLTGKVSVAGDAKTTLTCNGEAVTLGRNGDFSLTVALEQGTNRFTFTATNFYGASSTKTAIITVEDEALPTLRILSSVPERVTESSLKINGKINDYKAGHTLTLDERVVRTDSEGYFELALNLSPGKNTFRVEVLADGEVADAKTITVTRQETEGAGEWLNALPAFVNSTDYIVETKTQYRTRTRTTKTDSASTLSGWTLVKTGGSWGNWSGWQDGAVSASGTRQVETRSVEVSPARTEYRYGYYTVGQYDYWCVEYGKSQNPGGAVSEHNASWSTTRLPKVDRRVYCGDKSHNHKHVASQEVNGADTWISTGRTPNGRAGTAAFTTSGRKAGRWRR